MLSGVRYSLKLVSLQATVEATTENPEEIDVDDGEEEESDAEGEGGEGEDQENQGHAPGG